MAELVIAPAVKADGNMIEILDPCAEDVPEELGLSPNLPNLRGAESAG